MTTPRLALPLISAGQAQKHVTHNEALVLLDGLVQLRVEGFDASSPPGLPVDGEVWALGGSPTGAWSGQAGKLALRSNGGWIFISPSAGWRAALGAELRVHDGSAWLRLPLAVGSWGSRTGARVLTEALGPLSGATVDSTVLIPARSIVLGVSTRTSTAITGAASYDCGIAGEANKFGGSLGAAAGSSNVGVIGPQAFYADTAVRLTANGGAFTAGVVRIAIHLLTFEPPA